VLQAQATYLVGSAKQAVAERLPLGDHHSDPYGPGPVPTTTANGRGTP